ncbi:MAG: hypothetical protein ABSF83_10765, partial [Nitrososphaerales archaeon]
RYGNTERVARAFERGLRRAGVETVSLRTRDSPVESLAEFDLICVGGPTEWHSSSKRMKAFLRDLGGLDLAGRCGFAFETKLPRRLSGSAAEAIESALERAGAEIVAHRESAKVYLVEGIPGGASLEEGEEERFEEIGARVGRAFASRGDGPRKGLGPRRHPPADP